MATIPVLPPDVVVLAENELDLLELALHGLLDFPLAFLGDVAVTLTDQENTPLATWDGRNLTPVKPFATAIGPQWDPAVRLAATQVTELLAGAPTLGFVISDLPTREDIQTLIRHITGMVAAQSRTPEATEADCPVPRVLLLVPTSRQAPNPGLLRAVQAVATQLPQDVQIHVVAVPWPTTPPPELTWQLLAQKLGIAQLVSLSECRSPQVRSQITALDGIWQHQVAEIYPDASAREYLATHQPSGAAGTATAGTVILFTGLSGSGKSTIAKAVAAQLADLGVPTTLLDGDEVRQHLSKGLGFDRDSREINLDRIGYVAALVARHGGVVLAAPIAPFAVSRAHMRDLAVQMGTRFLLVYVSTPLAVCEARDRKGLYAKARAGLVPEFTGISSTYEVPDDADLVLDASVVAIADAVAQVLALLGSDRNQVSL